MGTTQSFGNRNVAFGSDTSFIKPDLVQHIGSIVDIPVRKAMLGCVVGVLIVSIGRKGALSNQGRRYEVKAPRIIKFKFVHESKHTGLVTVPIGLGQ